MSFMGGDIAELIPYCQQNCFRDTSGSIADNIPHMQTDFQLRLRERIAERGLSYRAASLNANLSPDAVGKMLKDGAGLPRGGNLEGLARALGTTEQWLLTGDATELPGAGAEARAYTPHDDQHEIEIKAAAAGSDDGAFQLFDNAIGWTARPRGLSKYDDVYAIIVINDSMVPEHRPGNIRYVTPSLPARTGDSVVVEFTRDPDRGPEAMIGHLQQRGEIVRIGKLNPVKTIDIHRRAILRLHRIASPSEL